MAKITIIGAGSVEFTRSILSDLFTYPEFTGGALSIALHDIDPDRLAASEGVARYINERTGAGAAIRANLERRDALADADYVINEIQVGGYAATLRDFDIPKKFGLRQTIADTIGIGGIFRGLRTIPVMLAIANDMASVCPTALLLNYANPMAMLPWAVYAGTNFRNVVGICHSVRDTHAFLAETVGVPESEITFVTAGFNHPAFVLRFERGGENLYPMLTKAVEADPEGLGRRVRVELFRQFGFFPTESSEHSSEYLPWFLRSDELIDRYRIPVDEYVRRSDENLEEFTRIKHQLESGAGFEIEPASELASEIVHSIETDTKRSVYVNVRNDGLIDSLAAESCVEVPAEVDGGGIHPSRVGPLPVQLAALNRTFLNVVELTVRAAIEEDRRHVYQAAILDPNAAATLGLAEIHAMCDELIEAHGDLMPEGIRRR